MNVFISSDLHFYHKNILKFMPDQRPFDTVEEMNEEIIVRHNSLVKKNDHWYHLGDFAFTNNKNINELLSRMNGRKHFVLGNHDKQFRKINVDDHPDIEWIRQYHELNLKQYGYDIPPLAMFHYPIDNWNRKFHGAYHIHGHQHAKGDVVNKRFDVGIDGNNLYPYELSEVIEILQSMDRDEND